MAPARDSRRIIAAIGAGRIRFTLPRESKIIRERFDRRSDAAGGAP